MKDFYIITDQSDVILHELGAKLGEAKINIEGLCFISIEDKSHIHFAVENHDEALHILRNSDIDVSSISDVFVFDKDESNVTGKPGSFGLICQRLKENGISMQFGYPAEHNRFIFGVDNFEKAKEILR